MEALLANLPGVDTATVGDKYQLAGKINMEKHFLQGLGNEKRGS